MEVAILFGLVIVFLFAGVPIAICLGRSSIIFMLGFSDGSLASIAQTLFSAFHGHYTLLAIPFFILASTFMATGGVARRIIRFAISVVGHIRGGLAIASVFASMMFAALSGSSPATVIAVGTIAIAGMREVGYTKEFSAGVICNAGTLGILIPPSIVMVVYAAATDVSVGRMFLAGVVPGLVAGSMLMAGIYVIALWKGLPSQSWAGWREVFCAASDAVWGLLLIVIILGGIYGGIFTPTEAASVAVVYGFIVSFFVYKELSIEDIPKVLLNTCSLSGVVLLVLATASMFSFILTFERIPHALAQLIVSYADNWILFIILVHIVFILLGMVMDALPAIIVLMPIFLPVAVSLGMEPIHLGILVAANVGIGMITPPVGICLFVACGISKTPIGSVVKPLLPFLIFLIFTLIIITMFPEITLFLPRLLGFI